MSSYLHLIPDGLSCRASLQMLIPGAGGLDARWVLCAKPPTPLWLISLFPEQVGVALIHQTLDPLTEPSEFHSN